MSPLKAQPGVPEARGVGQAAVGQVRGERLVQPEVVPPAHRDEIAEPHVGELMEHHLAAHEALRVGGRVAEEQAVVQRHGAHVLHGAGVELGHEDLVVLAERVGASEEVDEVLETLRGDLEELLDGPLQLGAHGAPAEQPELHVAVPPTDALIGSRDEREDVAGERRGRREGVAAASASRLDLVRGLRRDDLPALGCGHGQSIGRP